MSSDNYLVISSDQCLSVVLRQLCVDLVPSDGAVKTLFFCSQFLYKECLVSQTSKGK